MPTDNGEPTIHNERELILCLGCRYFSYGREREAVRALRRRTDQEYYAALKQYIQANQGRTDEIGQAGLRFAIEKLQEIRERAEVVVFGQ